jgi:hypothetical protein
LSKPSRRATRAADRSTGRGGASYAGDRSSPRAGRRDRARTGYYRRSFFSRYRNWIFGVGGVAAVAIVFGFLFIGATAKTYACSNIWDPTASATPSPSAGATPQLGYLQPDMGRLHNATDHQRYTNCPPASGSHYFAQGLGPIEAHVYGPDDFAEPQGWVHNLEHGALVVLYRCDGDACSDAGQQRLKDFFQSFPPSPICKIRPGVIGPVVARFDDMKWPYAALVWDRVLPLQSFDAQQILAFWQQWGEKTNPEKQCGTASPSPGASTQPGGSGASSGSILPSASAAAPSSASQEPSASPG